ncbi:putative retinol dehydrogenase 8 [Rosellinia necatrix]|uniref:Putative retinol dehydrogenase 8 n=1 Tax=Rosellinia necatrix TaxID=77044 RepID=A0A1W2TJX6_ROSNE|nr:putative retinol dehydrogenase 8 [Rosellinia necatrix]
MAAETKTSKPLTWLITGSSSGFGLELTRLAQARGHRVIATSRDPARTPALVDEVVGRGGRWLALDLTDLESGGVIDRLEAEGTRIDVLVNAAGMGIAGALESFSEAEARRQMDTNFFGPFRLVRAVTPHMRRRRAGVIVNFSSGAGLEAMHSLGVYGASKAALDDMTKVLHKELEPFGVRVVLVYLGTFDTPMASSVQAVAAPLDPDYEGTQTQRLFDMLRTGDFALPGDHRKACAAIYDLVVGAGPMGARGGELMLPLGRDLAGTVRRTQDRLAHMMDVFGKICHNVNVDDGTQSSW